MVSSAELKQDLLQQLLVLLQEEQKVLERSIQNAGEGATHPDAKPENKYDTRGLESSYLAGAQQERLQELMGSILLLRSLELRTFSAEQPIAATALVRLLMDEQEKLYWLLAVGAGYSLHGNFAQVLTITPQSPLGKALLGRHCGDSFVFKLAQSSRECEILEIW